MIKKINNVGVKGMDTTLEELSLRGFPIGSDISAHDTDDLPKEELENI